MNLRLSRLFQQLNWLVFFAYLLFGLGGGVAVACCPTATSVCAGHATAEVAEACLMVIAEEAGTCHTCCHSRQPVGLDNVHLTSFPSSSPVDDGAGPPLFSPREISSAPVPVTEFFLRHVTRQPNSVLASLGTVVLLI
ncbi:hypothetical protein [Geothermobacter hydrogeniphilus]|uniref:hypothetical protein n=1 Tax=Geothermobacter hydrogeniphilus TaxID=1969733 RepID=UPI00111C507C|nr:hypothetical protein [Geothermobacter hydrogeniphilus]